MATTRSSATLLDADPSLLTRKLMLTDEAGSYKSEELTELLPQRAPHAVTIKPQPGVCVKTRVTGAAEAGAKKVFVNLCTSDTVPPPDDLTDQELIETLESDEPSNFRIPLSIGEPHEESDKSGKACTAYDVVINPTFLEKSKYNPLFHNVLVVATLEAIELKYSIELDKNGWTVLKNKLYLGTAREQCVRTVMPLVQEVTAARPTPTGTTTTNNTDDSKTSGFDIVRKTSPASSELLQDNKTATTTNKNKHDRMLTPVTTKKNSREESAKRKPECVLRRVMEEVPGGGQEMVAVTAHVDLPGVTRSDDVSVLLGEDRVVLESSVHFLDVMLPCTVDADAAVAHYVKDKQMMVITAPVLAA